jgi:hypothetical protein
VVNNVKNNNLLRIIFVWNYGTAKEKKTFVFMGSWTTNIYNNPVETHIRKFVNWPVINKATAAILSQLIIETKSSLEAINH